MSLDQMRDPYMDHSNVARAKTQFNQKVAAFFNVIARIRGCKRLIFYSNTSSDISFLNDLDAQSDFEKNCHKRTGQVELFLSYVCSGTV